MPQDFLYPLKTSENQRFSDVFRVVERLTSGKKLVKQNKLNILPTNKNSPLKLFLKNYCY